MIPSVLHLCVIEDLQQLRVVLLLREVVSTTLHASRSLKHVIPYHVLKKG